MDITKRDVLPVIAGMGVAAAVLTTARRVEAESSGPWLDLCADPEVSDTQGVIHFDNGAAVPFPIAAHGEAASFLDVASDIELEYGALAEAVSVSRNAFKQMRRNNLIDYVPLTHPDKHFPTFMGKRLYVPGSRLAREYQV